MLLPVTAIFDIGKTNKKFVLFDENMNEVAEESMSFEELDDDDGDPCDDLDGIASWVKDIFEAYVNSREYDIQALNFATYGATLVHLGRDGQPVTPLYNYLKHFPQEVEEKLLENIDIEKNNIETASPYLGMLNSGLQLFWLKETKPDVFAKVDCSLHLPQYFSYLFTGKRVSELTSIGCHTKMWDFRNHAYHSWLKGYGLMNVLPAPISVLEKKEIDYKGKKLKVGVGIHDSSATLVPYFAECTEPFILISTGTWSITLNPFTRENLTREELDKDCLQYMNIHGKPVKASRLFLGNELSKQVEKLNEVFGKQPDYYKTVKPDSGFLDLIGQGEVGTWFLPEAFNNRPSVSAVFDPQTWNPHKYKSYDEAYHHLNFGLAMLQREAFKLAEGKSEIRKVYLDGGFVHNEIFLSILRQLMPDCEITVNDKPVGTALGAALVMKMGGE